MATTRSLKLGKLLAHLPKDGVGARVFQSRWTDKGLPTPTTASTPLTNACFWDVRKVQSTLASSDRLNTKAWGVLYWKGKRVTPEDKEYEPITGALKYAWSASHEPPTLRYVPKAVAQAENPKA